jgi:hypothetical protein
MSEPDTSDECKQLMHIIKQALDDSPHTFNNSQLKDSAFAALRRMYKKRGKCNKALAYIMKYSLESGSYHSFTCRDFAIAIHDEAKKYLEGKA